ncbi:hypothetical protein ACFL0V_03620, partial [Nanoarchaeota archaeon]
MKKVLLLAIFAILLSHAVIAETVGVLPKVTAEFNEQVTIISAIFHNLNTQQNYEAAWPTPVGYKYIFQPSKALPNGNYEFIVLASDLVGNSKEYKYTFTVYEEETRILLTTPNSLGYAKGSPFNVSVFTSKASACRYSGVPTYSYEDIKLKDFDITGNITTNTRVYDHTIIDYAVDPDFPKLIYVVCNDAIGRDVLQDFTLYTD